MPPYTRRSSGWTNNGNETPGRDGGGGGPNIEYFLEHLEQFKRKHISQNRDIIKSNAFLQLRIRDLESRIQSMEVDKHQNYRAIARLKYELHQASQQGSVNGRDIWLELGKSMGFLDEEAAGASGSAVGRRLRRPVVPPMNSVRIELDPESLPGGVVRAIARAPGEEGILEESEDEAMEEAQHRAAGYEGQERLYERLHMPVDFGGSAASSAAASPAASLLHEEPSAPPTPEPERMAIPGPAPQRSAPQWTSFLPPVSNGESSVPVAAKPKKSEAMKGKKSAALPSSANQRQDRLSAKPSSAVKVAKEQPMKPAAVLEQVKPQARPAAREVLDEGMEDAAELQSKRAPKDTVMADSERLATAREPSKQRVSSASSSKTLVNPDEPSPSRTTSRKRKPSSGREPTILTDVTSLALPTYSDPMEDVYDTPATDEEDAPAASGGRSSRRSSVRARPSINYALPKLNTKMRKPDPEEVRGTGSLSSAALNGPPTLVGTGEGEANGDLKDIKRERQMRQGVSAASASSAAARKSSAPHPAKSRTSKSGSRSSRLNGEASASEDEEADGDDERGRSSALNSELESSADERENEHGSVHNANGWQRQGVNGDRRRTKSHTPISYQESEDEGEDTIVASAPPAANSARSVSAPTRPAAATGQYTDSDEEIEVARSSAAEQEYDEDGDVTMPAASSAPAPAGPSSRVQAPMRTASADSAATTSKRPAAASSAEGSAASRERERSVSANAILPSTERGASVVKSGSATAGPATGSSSKPAAAAASASRPSSSSQALNGVPPSSSSTSSFRPSSTSADGSSSTSTSRPSLASSLSATGSTGSTTTSSKRPFSSAGALTDADLALLAQSTSSLADLTSASAWPSTPQVGGGGGVAGRGVFKGVARGVGAGAQGGTTGGGKKVSTLSRFSNAPGGGVGGAGQGRALGKIKPFNLSASSSLNGTAGTAPPASSGGATAGVGGAGVGGIARSNTTSSVPGGAGNENRGPASTTSSS